MIKFNILKVLLFLILLFAVTESKAQMFSVSSQNPSTYTPSTSFYLGAETLRFTFRDSDNLPEQNFNFDDIIYRFRAELPGLQVYLGYNNRVGVDEELSYLNAGAVIDGQYVIYRRPSFFMTLPLMLKTDYTQVVIRSGSTSTDDFQQSSALIGAGLMLHFRINPSIRMQAKFVPQYGFSVTSFGGTGGNVSILEGQYRIFFDNLFSRVGLVAGYDYRKSVYDLEEELFNYRRMNHSILIGVTF